MLNMIENTQLLENRKEFERELKTYPYTIANKNVKNMLFQDEAIDRNTFYLNIAGEEPESLSVSNVVKRDITELLYQDYLQSCV